MLRYVLVYNYLIVILGIQLYVPDSYLSIVEPIVTCSTFLTKCCINLADAFSTRAKIRGGGQLINYYPAEIYLARVLSILKLRRS